MKTTKLPMVFSYISKEEKIALDMLATLENRSTSSLLRVLIVNELKNRGLLREEFNDKYELVQHVNFEVKRD